MTTELLICVMAWRVMGFQNSKCSSNYIRQGIACKLYSTGCRLSLFTDSQEKYLNIKQKKKEFPDSTFQVAVMCFVKYTSDICSDVLRSKSYQACIHVFFGNVRIHLRLFTLLYADCIFILNLASWVGAHSKVQCAVPLLERGDIEPS